MTKTEDAPKKLRVIELFSGIGATRAALDRLGIDVEHVAQCELDKYAVISYNAIFGETPNLGDITKVEKLPECDLLSWTFPCTDLSKAGRGAGMDKDSGTRSALGWEVIRLLNAAEVKPEWLLMENVPAVHSKKNIGVFNEMIKALSDMGYNSVWHDMKAQDHGIGQNRNRCIMISRLNKAVPEFGKPRANAKKTVLRDFLEENVDLKYYLNEKDLQRVLFKNDKNKERGRHFDFTPRTPDAPACTVTAKAGGRETDNYVMCKLVANLNKPGWHECCNRVYSPDGLSPTINTCQGGGHEVKIAFKVKGTLKVVNGSKKGYMEAKAGDGIILGFYTGSQTARGRVQNQMAPTLQTSINAAVVEFDGEYWAMRKLTPRECWRLFGRTDSEFDAAVNAGISNTQLYKQAGNSIVVNVLEDALKDVLLDNKKSQSKLI